MNKELFLPVLVEQYTMNTHMFSAIKPMPFRLFM